MRLETKSGMVILLGENRKGLFIATIGTGPCTFSGGDITPTEAIEIAAELVKLAMPDAKPDTAPVSIM